jgi:hypothetical protein
MERLCVATMQLNLMRVSIIFCAFLFWLSSGQWGTSGQSFSETISAPALSLIPVPVTFTVSPLSVSYFSSVVVTVNITEPPATGENLVTSYSTTNGADDVVWPQDDSTVAIYTRIWEVTDLPFSVWNFTLSGPANTSYGVTNTAPINVTLIGIAINVTHSTATPVGDGNYSAMVFVTLASFPTSMSTANLTLTPNLGGANGAVHDLILSRGVGYLTFDQNTSLTESFTVSAPDSTYQVPLTFTLGGSVAFAYTAPPLTTIDLVRSHIVPTSSLTFTVTFWGTWT